MVVPQVRSEFVEEWGERQMRPRGVTLAVVQKGYRDDGGGDDHKHNGPESK
jgi:hypothetical protein